VRIRPVVVAVTALAVLGCAAQLRAAAASAPQVAVSSPASGSLVEGTTLVTGTAAPGSFPILRVVVGVDGADGNVASGSSHWSASLNSGAYPDGYHTVTVRALDAGGNTGYASVPVLFSNSRWSTPTSTTGTGTRTPVTAPTPVVTADTTAAPASIPTFAFGAQYHGMWENYTPTDRVAALDKLVQAGAKWIRMDVGWAAMEGAGPGQITSWYISRMDNLVNIARKRGLNILVTFYGTPGWANGGRGPTYPPTNPMTFGRITKWMAQHFASRVAAWEVWNEPNHTTSWNGTVLQYVTLLKQAYAGYKGGDPNALVVLGGPAGNDTDWIQRMYMYGGHGYFDVMATHPYESPSDMPPETDNGSTSTISHVRDVKSLMDQYGDGAKPIWFTEFGWSTHVNTGTEQPWRRGVSPEMQADYLVRTLKLVRSNFPYVTTTFWYCERDTDTSGSYDGSFGLMNRDLTPKPSYSAVQSYLASNP